MKAKQEKNCGTCCHYASGTCQKEGVKMTPDSWCKLGWQEKYDA